MKLSWTFNLRRVLGLAVAGVAAVGLSACVVAPVGPAYGYSYDAYGNAYVPVYSTYVAPSYVAPPVYDPYVGFGPSVVIQGGWGWGYRGGWRR